jgi:hypothetical protein
MSQGETCPEDIAAFFARRFKYSDHVPVRQHPQKPNLSIRRKHQHQLETVTGTIETTNQSQQTATEAKEIKEGRKGTRDTDSGI